MVNSKLLPLETLFFHCLRAPVEVTPDIQAEINAGRLDFPPIAITLATGKGRAATQAEITAYLARRRTVR